MSAEQEGKDLRFVYKFPDAEVSPFNLMSLKRSNIAVSRADEGFSALISFRSHMRYTSGR